MSEKWLPVPGLPDYEVSDAGRIRSWHLPGRSPRVPLPREWKSPRVLSSTVGPCGFHTTRVKTGDDRRNVRVAELVARAFLGERPAGAELRYLNADPTDSRLVNLRWGTKAEVVADHVARAVREGPADCPECGSALQDTWLGDWGRRRCGVCLSRRTQAWRDSNPDVVAAASAKHNARRRAAYAAAPPRTGVCEDCGDAVTPRKGLGPLAKRCPECRWKRRREQSRVRMTRVRAGSRSTGASS